MINRAFGPLFIFKGDERMELDIKLVLQLYQEELSKIQNENLLLKAEVIQLREKLKAVGYPEGDE